MSIRRGDENLLYIIRTLQARVERLENHHERTRRNDVRVGNLIISWDEATSQATLVRLNGTGIPVTIHVT